MVEAFVKKNATQEEALDKIDEDIARLRMRESCRVSLESAPVNSAYADHQALGIVLDSLSSQIMRLR